EAVLDDGEVVVAVVNKVVIHGAPRAQRLAVSQDDGAGRVGVDHVAALDTAGQHAGADCQAHQPQPLLDRFRLFRATSAFEGPNSIPEVAKPVKWIGGTSHQSGYYATPPSPCSIDNKNGKRGEEGSCC